MTSTDYPGGQTEAKLIAGWLETARPEYQAFGGRPRHAHLRHLQRRRPDLEARLRPRRVGLGGLLRPRPDAHCLTTAQIGTLNEPYWSNTRYDALNTVQSSTIDPQARKTAISQMRQLMYQQSPWIVLNYPEDLQAYNTARWTGWQQMFGGTAPFDAEGFIGSYLALRPESPGGHASSGTLITVAIVAAIVVALGAFALTRRRRHRLSRRPALMGAAAPAAGRRTVAPRHRGRHRPDQRRRLPAAPAVATRWSGRGARRLRRAVGARAEVAELVGPTTRTIDLRGATVLPGFIDAHAHVSAGVTLLCEAQLSGEPREAFPASSPSFSRRTRTPQLCGAAAGPQCSSTPSGRAKRTSTRSTTHDRSC